LNYEHEHIRRALLDALAALRARRLDLAEDLLIDATAHFVVMAPRCDQCPNPPKSEKPG